MEADGTDITFDCNFFEFTQLYEPANPIRADVIAITGLDGHAYGSWRGKGELSRMWLRDFLPKDLPQCRVLTYGYNSKLTGKSRGLERILDYGRGFLEEIKQVRRTDEEMRRPLIFIAHSFGGLILAQSLVKAFISADPINRLFYDATYAILFFGTPHRGLSVDDIRGLLPDQGHPRHGLLDQIKSNSDSLVDQLGNFKNIIHDRKIVSFYEAEQTPQLINDNVSGKWKRMGSFATAVSTDSALLNLPDHMEEKIPLSSDHSTMVKFDSRDNKGYQLAISRLRKFQADAASVVASRLRSSPALTKYPVTGYEELKGNSAMSTGLETNMNSLKCCEMRPKADLTSDNLDALPSTAYELFASLKNKNPSINQRLEELERPLFEFKCSLTHLAGNLSLVASNPGSREKLQVMTRASWQLLEQLHELIEHESGSLSITDLRKEVDRQVENTQRLMDTVVGPSSDNSDLSRHGHEARVDLLGTRGKMLSKKKMPGYPPNLRGRRPEKMPKPAAEAFTLSPPNSGAYLTAFSATSNTHPFAPSPSMAMHAPEKAASGVSHHTQEITATNSLPENLAALNLRRRIASTEALGKLQGSTTHQPAPRIPATSSATMGGKNENRYLTAPYDWTRQLSEVFPMQLGDKKSVAGEFFDCLCKLNVHISELPKDARISFRRHLEEDGSFEKAIEQARLELKDFALVRKEIDVYEDDKEDDA